MIRDLKLAIRLFRGGGTTELMRLGLMALGLGLAVTAVLVVAQVPHVLDYRDAVLRGREPVSVSTDANGRSRIEASISKGSWRGVPLTRVFITTSDPNAGTPPGISRLPQPGERFLSPAAQALVDRGGASTDFTTLIPGHTVGEINSSGLTDPDELFGYIGVSAEQQAASRTVDYWGLPDGVRVDGADQHRWVAAETAALLLPVTGVFIAVCGRLAAATRRRRYAALSLVGASRRTVTRIAALEAGVAAVFGTALGVVGHASLNGALGRSGLLGFNWFPAQGELSPFSAIALFATAIICARLAGRYGGRRANAAALLERRDSTARRPHWWRLFPLVIGVGLLIPLLPTGHGYQGPLLQGGLLLGSGLAVLGVFTSATQVTALLGTFLNCRRASLGIRLGTARASTTGDGTTLALGLGLLILVSAIGTGLSELALMSATSSRSPIHVHIYANEIAPQARSAVADLRESNEGEAILHSVVRPDRNGEAPDLDDLGWQLRNVGVEALVGDCGQLRRSLAQEFSNCRPDQWYRVIDRSASVNLPVGARVPFETPSGTRIVAAPPSAVVVVASNPSRRPALVYSGAEPPGGWPDSTTFFFRLDPGMRSLDAFSTALARVAPTSSAAASLDLTAITSYRAHQSAIKFGTRVGYGVGLLATLIAWVDRGWERRRATAMLVAIGVGRWTLRTAQAVEALVPVATLSALAAGVGWLIANAFAGLDDPHPTWSAAPFLLAVRFAAAGVVIAAGSSLTLTGLRPRPEDLRRE